MLIFEVTDVSYDNNNMIMVLKIELQLESQNPYSTKL